MDKLVPLWQVIGALAIFVAALGGIAHAASRAYLRGIEERLSAAARLAETVAGHSRDILEIGRRLGALESSLQRLDGELAGELRRVDQGITSLRESLAGLRGELKIVDRIRGLIGRRPEDREPHEGS
jgi:hypothetical protein